VANMAGTSQPPMACRDDCLLWCVTIEIFFLWCATTEQRSLRNTKAQWKKI